MLLLSTEGITAGYDGAAAIRDVSLSVEEGEIVAILGPNGAGKSTLLRAISGVVPLLAGRLTFADTVLTRQLPEDRAALGIAHVPEGRGIIGGLSVADNLRLGASTRRDSRAAVEADRDRLLDLFPQLRPKLADRAASLSGGQQQMLTLARALIARPRLVMIDELSFGLAPRIVGELLGQVRELRKAGTAFLIVEQQAAVMAVADRVYLLSGGAVRLVPETVGLRDRRDFVERYFGTAS
ncbi:ABC transporter ATP-binding protein [Pseudonocardia sp. GCM10023141]|uniref:ABC transporter ATP-binding protein n=1 Tax=Pseudonocardia sp. GCM10023141 TaxID=3252653 RepID=UPI003616E188